MKEGVRMVVGGGGLHLFRIGLLFGDEELLGSDELITIVETSY
ncbi:hypothetical protein RchiOBHm_Chr7g0189031 [Rosa chinensis]|uniref:Uncharacterized protein n=1 Tax=Rosa chinensis TaxID=74649 RepID=A0A2P6P4Q7_ROSCH|nr:hypothetical protein RchiOBHm_Chr7g0189031 [Rosa chinensis]